MKARTEKLAIEWLKTAKSSDTFMINTKPHSKKEVEKMLGLDVQKMELHSIIDEDIKTEEKDADMGPEEDHGDSE